MSKKRLMILAVTAALLLTSSLSGCGSSDNNNTNSSNTGSSSVVSSDTNPVSADAIAAKSENFSIPKPIAYFLFNNTYSQRREYAAFQGLDVTKKLKDQYYNEEAGITWFDVFMDETKRYLQQVLVLSEAAKAAGVELEEADLETVEQTVQNIKSSAESVNMTFEEYIHALFGDGITEDIIREYAKLTTLTNKYYLQVYNGYSYTDEDYEKYFEENKTSYQYADFIQYNFSYASGSETSTDEAAQKAAREKAKAYADNLAQCKTATEFKSYVRDYLTKNPELVTASADHTLTEQELKEAIETEVEKCAYEKYAYEVTSNAGKWLFDESRKTRDTTVIENANSYTVLMITKTAYRDETVTKNVRHILFTPASYKSDATATDEDAAAAALKMANQVYDTWKAGDKTEESFAALAKQFSDDTGSKENGGLYTDVTSGTMVPEFNDWLFDSSRKPGDTGIVKTTYGYHIMYFVSDSSPAWQLSVDTVMRKTDFQEEYQTFAEKYTVEFVDEVLATISEAEVKETSAITYDESSVTSSTASAESAASTESTASAESTASTESAASATA